MEKILTFAPLTDFQTRRQETVDSLAASMKLGTAEFRKLPAACQDALIRAALELAFANGGCAALETTPSQPKQPLTVAGTA